MSPRVITFYSYKGGTGRTMALANVAWVLASNGKRVLAIDWDLESPGLHQYFRPFLRDPSLLSTRGLIDFIVDFAADTATGRIATPGTLLHFASSLDFAFSGRGTIDLIGAGCLDPTYALRVNTFSWQSFYERLGGNVLLDQMKKEFAAYDYVLIDSRAGVSDYASICTADMPDALVACFTLNRQSVEGTASVVQSVLQQRGARRVEVFPVPMRIDHAEKEQLERARGGALSRFHELSIKLKLDYWDRMEFPYIPYFAYNEVLAAFIERPFLTRSILNASETLTGYLTEGAVTQAIPVPEPTRTRVQRAFATGTSADGGKAWR